MQFANRFLSEAMLVCCGLVISTAAPAALAKEAVAIASKPPLGHDDNSFIFAGQCPNGEKYRLHAYQQVVASIPETFYDYEGPAGKGTVRTPASPKTMSVRVCRQLAEIINTNYWD